MTEEPHSAFILQDEIGPCLQVGGIISSVHGEVPFCVHPYVIKEQKLAIEKENNCLEKLGIFKKGFTGYSSPVLLVKRKHQNLHRVLKISGLSMTSYLKSINAFPLVRGCIPAKSQSQCEGMRVADLGDAYQTLRLALDS